MILINLIMMLFFGCSKSNTFFNTINKVKKIESDKISEQILSAVTLNLSDISSEGILQNVLKPFVEKYSPETIQNNSICSIILDNENLFLEHSLHHTTLLNILFNIMINDKQIAERELSFVDSDRGNLFHIILEKGDFRSFDGIVEKMDKITLQSTDDEKSFKKYFLKRVLLPCKDNKSFLALAMKQNRELALKIINHLQEDNFSKKKYFNLDYIFDSEDNFFHKSKDVFIYNNKINNDIIKEYYIYKNITPYGESIFSLSMEEDYKNLFDDIFDLVEKVDQIHLINSVCNINDNVYYLRKLLLKKDFNMTEELYRKLIVIASVNGKKI